mmetsp:Transcript_17757/g.29684  ORF Transcript_17757/g.29684 Transcript_17757/m.29684 type:complete len:504 (+) Transcript_17757:87-1598(+)
MSCTPSTADLWELLHLVLPRYLRITLKRADISFKRVIELLQHANENTIMLQVPWMPSFIAIPGYESISKLSLDIGKDGVAIFPMDLASGVPPFMLTSDRGPQAPRKVLDLCCCPGGKFLMLSDHIDSEATIVGIDVSQSRMNVTKSLVHKHLNAVYVSHSCQHLCPRMLLVRADGTTFSRDDRGELAYDSSIGLAEIERCGYKRKRNKSMRGREMRQLKDSWSAQANPLIVPDCLQKPKPSSSAVKDVAHTRVEEEEKIEGEWNGDGFFFGCFDAVLVDAQCTHDSSYRHLRYLSDNPANSCIGDSNSRLKDVVWTNECRSYKNIGSVASDESVYALQRDLIAKGFSCLAPGGELVYSTCSAEQEQNEDVVQWLLDKEKGNVEVVPVVDDWCGGCSSSDYLADKIDSALYRLVGLLSTQPPPYDELLNFLRQQLSCGPGLDSIHLLANEVCKHAASFQAAPGREGRLPGTAYFGMWACTSGLFVSRLRKLNTTTPQVVRTETT